MSAISPLIHIEPATTRIKRIGSQLVRTNFTIRSTYFQHIYNFLFPEEFHERFFTDHPTNSSRIEKSETIFRTEFLRTVICTVILNKITISVIISSTECPIFTIGRHHASPCIFLTAEQPHGCHIMFPKTTYPIQLCLIIKVTNCLAVIYSTRRSTPIYSLSPIETIIGIIGLFIPFLTCIWIYPLMLCTIIQIIDTTIVFNKNIIPRNSSPS